MKGANIVLKMLGGFFLFVVAIGVIGALFGGPPKEVQVSKVPLKSDRDLVNDFYREFRERSDRADNLYKPFSNSLAQGDIVGAVQVALRVDAPFRAIWGEMSRLKTPDLQNDQAEQKLDQAKEALAGCYLCKSTILSDTIKYSESPNAKKVAEIANTAENSQTLLIGGIAMMTKAGEMVGLQITDFK